MDAKKVETGHTDSISSLPDEVLGQMLSFLPTKLAASTSVLSKQWRNLLPLVHNLDFDESMVLYPNTKSSAATGGHGFVNFVEKTLFLLGDSPLIKKFSLKWESEVAKSCANCLIYMALERGVLELDLRSSGITGIEKKFFMSKTLVKLTLSLGCYYPKEKIEPPGGVYFPALKSLTLNSVRFEYYHMYVWILSSPVLEEYNVCDEDPAKSGWEGWVWGSSIKRITILHRYYYPKEHSMVAIRTPNLVFLDYSSYVTKNYHVKLDSLVEARLDLKLWKYYVPPYPTLYPVPEYWGDASQLMAGIRNLVTLHLSADCLEVLHFCCKSKPELNNLLTLTFESHEERSWQGVPWLLKKSPKLETLSIKGLVHKITKGCGDVCVCERETKMKRTYCSLLSCRVKVLKVYGYGGSCRELKQMKYFLDKLRRLEVVQVGFQVVDHQQHECFPLINDLMKLLPTASSKCQIQFI